MAIPAISGPLLKEQHCLQPNNEEHPASHHVKPGAAACPKDRNLRIPVCLVPAVPLAQLRIFCNDLLFSVAFYTIRR